MKICAAWRGILLASLLLFVTAPDTWAAASSRKGSYQVVLSAQTGNGLLGIGSLKISRGDSFTGKVVLEGKSQRFRGTLDGSGSSGVISLGSSDYTAEFTAQDGADGIATGSLKNSGTEVGTFYAERNPYSKANPCPYEGKYTLLVKPSTSVASPRSGSGFGVAKVKNSGKVNLVARLNDGSKIAQGGQFILTNGWPLYRTLDKGKGVISGMIAFRDVPGVSDFDGSVSLSIAGSTPETLAVVGSAFQEGRSEDRILNFADGEDNARLAVYSAGQSAPVTSEQVTVGAGNKVTTAEGSELKLSVQSSSGLFGGTIKLPRDGESVKFAGAILQKQSHGEGSYANSGDGGLVAFDRVISLTITAPEPSSTVVENPVTVEGFVSIRGEIIPLRIGQSLAETRMDGTFSLEYSVFPGESEIVVEVISGALIPVSRSVAVRFDPHSEGKGTINPGTGGTVEVLNQDSELFGAAIQVPPNAMTNAIEARIVFQPEDTPDLPYGLVQVGPSAIFQPTGQVFTLPVRLRLPIKSNLLPAGTTSSQVFVIADGDNGWATLPVVNRTAAYVEVEVMKLIYGDVVPVVERPLANGEIRIVTNPAGGTVYLDGFNTGLSTPCSLPDVASGTHQLKLYVGGFNEVFRSVTMSTAGQKIDLALSRPQNAPVIALDPALVDGLTVTDNVFTVRGSASVDGAALQNGRAVVVLNGEDFEVPLTTGGLFSGIVALQPGENLIETRVTTSDGVTGVTQPIHVINNRTATLNAPSTSSTIVTNVANAQGENVNVTLTWNTAGTDVDMHVTDDQGHHAWYGSLNGIPGGSLDHDDVDGFGPEIFTMLEPNPATYSLRVHYYSDHGRGATTASLAVRIGNQLVFSESYFLTNGQSWNAFQFTIGDLEVESVKTHVDSPINAAIFTTLPSENEITVRVRAPQTLPDSDIKLRVTETSNGSFPLDTDGVTFANREAKVRLASAGNYSNAVGKALKYEIVAYTETKSSSPKLLIQDRRSQIRQEYVDKRASNSGFARQTPSRDSIIDASQFYGPDIFPFSAFAAYSDFAGLAVIAASRDIADNLKVQYPDTVRLTSGWRNPRRNDRVGGTLNSYHQTGSGVDFNPNREGPWLPVGNAAAPTTYYQAQQAMYNFARALFPSPVYDVLLHGSDLHIHIEKND